MHSFKADQEGISYKDLVVMTYPTQVKGLAVLTWTYQDPEKDQNVWLWIPSLKKVRKISASEDDDAFMGSDFTVEEVSTQRLPPRKSSAKNKTFPILTHLLTILNASKP